MLALAPGYRAPRTPWGDPDLQGNYTNKYEQSTPLERPDAFAGRRRDDVTGAELTALLTARNRQVLARPEAVGPLQFRDPLEVTRGGLPWLIVDPPDGKIPTLTAEALRRLTAGCSFRTVGGVETDSSVNVAAAASPTGRSTTSATSRSGSAASRAACRAR
jgi:hypothetical protein